MEGANLGQIMITLYFQQVNWRVHIHRLLDSEAEFTPFQTHEGAHWNFIV